MSPRLRVLCVDDEPAVLQGLRLQLRRDYDVVIAEGGEAALKALAEPEETAVLISDMRMPGMDGAEVLAAAAQRAPHTTRMLLTGHADIEAAIRAINEGGAFRFLVKPCTRRTLKEAVAEAAQLHQLKKAEEQLLGQTLKGCMNAMTEVLSMAEPRAFGKVRRIDELCGAMLKTLDIPDAWALEVANVFDHLPYVTLPAETLDKLWARRPLEGPEGDMVAAVPKLAMTLCEHIPRLEPVQAILRDARRKNPQEPGGRVLRAARDYLELTDAGNQPGVAIAALRAREGANPEIIEALSTAVGTTSESATAVREARIVELMPGMVLEQDVVSAEGRLLIARGQVVSESLRRRLLNLGPGQVKEPFLVREADRSS